MQNAEYEVKKIMLSHAFGIHLDYDIEKDFKYPYHLTPYEGCVFKCAYCFNNALSKYWSHLNNGKEKPNEIAVAVNIVELIQNELPLINMISKLPLIVRIGTEAEIYGPAEKEYRLMPQIFNEFLKYPKWEIRIPTKSDLILRDIPLIKKLNVLVTITIVTTDDETAKIIEPFAPLPSRRIEVLRNLREHGIRCRVRCEPYICGISDLDNIMKLKKELELEEIKIKPLNYYSEEEILNIVKREKVILEQTELSKDNAKKNT